MSVVAATALMLYYCEKHLALMNLPAQLRCINCLGSLITEMVEVDCDGGLANIQHWVN